MAEYGAHLTTSVGQRPSIFEVLAQENLANGLRSASKYLSKVVASNSPQHFGFLLRYFEELYTLLDCVTQFSHLKSYGATFAEHFYGLKRIPAKWILARLTKIDHPWLPLKQFYFILLVVCGVPYLRYHMEALYERLKEKESDGVLENYEDNRKAACKFYLQVYPVIHFVWECVTLCYYIAYAADQTNYHSPLMHLTQTELTTLTSEDMKLFHGMENNGFHFKRWQQLPSYAFGSFTKALVSGMSTGLSIGAFFLQFVSWWYNREGSVQSFSPLPLPPFPSPQMPDETQPGICPLCHKRRTNDTVLATSGFVFCYPCIFNYIRRHKRCPITHYPATLNHLIRLSLS